jgi:hypothetical protein
VERADRRPAWSSALTAPVAGRVPAAWRPGVLTAIKTVHTLLFASISAALLLIVWDGLRRRPRRRTAIALAVALTESAVYASNNRVCPLTPLAEQLGAERGSVIDIFLPEWFADRVPVPLVAGSVFAVGLSLNLGVLVRSRSARRSLS